MSQKQKKTPKKATKSQVEPRTRKYTLSNSKKRHSTDLRQFESSIQNAVEQVKPHASVTVLRDGYIVENITRGEAVAIGKILRKDFEFATDLRTQYFISKPIDISNI